MPDNIYEQKIGFYNKVYRGFLLALGILSFIGIVVGVNQVFVVGRKIDLTLVRIETIITDNQASTLDARTANAARQENLKNYIKCIFLAKFDSPEAVLPTSTRQQVSDALDKCAGVK